MAGIGFEIRKLLKHDSLSGTLRAYAFAGMISSGPWVLSIVGMLLVGILTVGDVLPHVHVSQFQTSVTYLIACSLILSGILQHSFTRFVADAFFRREFNELIPNMHGAMIINEHHCWGSQCDFHLVTHAQHPRILSYFNDRWLYVAMQYLDAY